MAVGTAYADIERVDDGNDARGPLDIKWVRQGHEYGKIRYGVSTFGNWSSEDLRHGRFVFAFDVDQDAGFERYVVVHWRDWEKVDGGKLATPLKNSRWNRIGHVGAAHWSGNKLRIWLKREHLQDPTDYRMAVWSEWRRGPCDPRCVDDGIAMSHHLWPLCDGLDPTIVGTTGPDRIEGTRGSDVIYGGNGHDRIETGGGFDNACGGPGNDLLLGSRRPETLQGGSGDDMLFGRRATYICRDTATPPGTAGDCALPTNTLRGGSGDDELYGGKDNDYLYGGPGFDRLDGKAEEDWCYGGEVKQRC